MSSPSNSHSGDTLVNSEAPLLARLRFEDPAKFLEFYDKQLSRSVVGLRHGEPVADDTEVVVLISPPGAPDQLRLEGRAVQVTPRPDGSVRLRVSILVPEEEQRWLDAYLVGLRAALDRFPEPVEPVDVPTADTGGPPVPAISPAEIQALAVRLDTMTYYQILGVEPEDPLSGLQARFHDITRRLHPDLYFASTDAELQRQVGRVYRRVNEAYAVLKDARRRGLYDRGLAGPPHTWSLRLTEEAEQSLQRQRRARRGSTPTGHYYWTVAREVLERARDQDTNIRPALRESARLLRTALIFEPDNDHFRNALEHVSDRLLNDID